MDRLLPPPNGVTVRMYRPGHGDCFLLAFPPEKAEDGACYVLIDCGYKPGSDRVLHGRKVIDEIVDDIHEARGGRIDLFVVTHEHQDHVNGIWKRFAHRFQIMESWFPWTESPDDKDAIALRRRHHDQLLGLVAARQQLAALDEGYVRTLDELLWMEYGGEDDAFPAAALAATDNPEKSVNKQGMREVRTGSSTGRKAKYLDPTHTPLSIVGSAGVRAFVLGPPRQDSLFKDEDPVGSQGFPQRQAANGLTFGAAAHAADRATPAQSPFSRVYHASGTEPLFTRVYGAVPVVQPIISQSSIGRPEEEEAPDGAAWRRIDTDWLRTAENMALVMDSGINNTSLVLAFELPTSKKILLFIGDAQAGNWKSWTAQTWKDGEREVTARDLLGRTVLYKVGHHGSHNATLAGTDADEYPNLAWMGKGSYGSEFTAMITAVNEWAEAVRPPWHHPLASIKAALMAKTQGRVFQTDMKAEETSTLAWDALGDRCVFNDLSFDYTVLDE